MLHCSLFTLAVTGRIKVENSADWEAGSVEALPQADFSVFRDVGVPYSRQTLDLGRLEVTTQDGASEGTRKGLC